MNNFKIVWTATSKKDMRKIKNNISLNRLLEIYACPERIIFPEQFQIDQYRLDCRRIIVGNYKVLYQFNDELIKIVRVFNSLHHPEKSLF